MSSAFDFEKGLVRLARRLDCNLSDQYRYFAQCVESSCERAILSGELSGEQLAAAVRVYRVALLTAALRLVTYNDAIDLDRTLTYALG